MKRNSSGERLPTICFVLAAKDLGLYADMAAVAVLAVRRLHPQARTILVTDGPTARGIDHAGHALGNIVSEIIVQQTGTDDPVVSNRRIKTVLRHVVKGDHPDRDNWITRSTAMLRGTQRNVLPVFVPQARPAAFRES